MDYEPQSNPSMQAPQNGDAAAATVQEPSTAPPVVAAAMPTTPAAPSPPMPPVATPPDVPLFMPPPQGTANVTPEFAALDAARRARFPVDPSCFPPELARPPLPPLPQLPGAPRPPVVAAPAVRTSDAWRVRVPRPPAKVQKRRYKGSPAAADGPPPPAVGSKVRVHTFPENDPTQQPAWFDAVVCRCHPPPKKKSAQVEVRYDVDGSVDTLAWPEDQNDMEIIEAAAWDPDALAQWRAGGKGRGRRPPPPPPPKDAQYDADEAAHLVYFAFLQLRAEYAEIVAREDLGDGGRCSSLRRSAYDAFDREAAKTCPSDDFKSCGPLVEAFLTGPCAKGDKWMPWHCCLGAHERYLLHVVRRLPLLKDERSRSVVTFAFSGSRDIELFESLLRPLFETNASDADAALGQLLATQPLEALKRGGVLSQRYEVYRRRGRKLHTTCYQCHPPRGAAGDEFVHYIVDRTARFASLGLRVHAFLERMLGTNFFESCQLRVDATTGDELRQALEALLIAEREVGPTMAKMFLVSTHLAFPQARLLNASCAVGDGAEQAFDYLFPAIDARARSAHRALLLDALSAKLDAQELDRLEPRLRPMLRFVGKAARARFGLCGAVVADEVTPFDLQVHLCEWRKFRTRVDRMRLCRRGAVLDRARALRAVEAARRTRKSPAQRK